MKITSRAPVTGPDRRRRVSSGAAGFAEQVGARPATRAGLAPAAPLAALESVLAVQEVGDDAEDRRRALRRGHSLLDELHALQIGLIGGGPPESAVQRIAAVLGLPRPDSRDPGLEEVLDSIELRAAVELAKLRREPK